MSNILTFKGISSYDLYLLWIVFFQYVCFSNSVKLHHLLKAIKTILTLRNAARAYLKEIDACKSCLMSFQTIATLFWLRSVKSTQTVRRQDAVRRAEEKLMASPVNKFALARISILLFLYVCASCSRTLLIKVGQQNWPGIRKGEFPQPRLERSLIQMEVLVKKLDREEERRQGSIWQHQLRYSEGRRIWSLDCEQLLKHTQELLWSDWWN